MQGAPSIDTKEQQLEGSEGGERGERRGREAVIGKGSRRIRVGPKWCPLLRDTDRIQGSRNPHRTRAAQGRRRSGKRLR
ncbi:hypothetical protein F2P79_009704 [Pimephales promelas]|nr:hypothetical protein F2P79_009704 [Pimephales promelas]